MKGSLYFLDLAQRPEAPGSQRMEAFKKHFKDYKVQTLSRPNNLVEYLSLWFQLMFKRKLTLWISMPPFTLWSLLLLPAPKKILDIRDGWSIAMQEGYGGTSSPSVLKAKIARFIEFFAFLLSHKVIVCTPGLKNYYESFLPTFLFKKTVLIPNGFEKIHYSGIKSISQSKILRCVCAGKFSAYGKDRAKLVIKRLLEKYSDREIKFTIIGPHRSENEWLEQYFMENKLPIQLDLLPTMTPANLDAKLAETDLGIAVVRDPYYELGTKSFLYVAHGIPIFNYFTETNNFTHFFSGCLDSEIRNDLDNSKFSREYQINKMDDTLSL